MTRRKGRRKTIQQAPQSELLFALAFIGIASIYFLFTQVGGARQQVFVISFVGIVVVVGASIIGLSIYRSYMKRQLMRSLAIAQIDELSGVAFESYIAEIFKHQGYNVIETPKTGDFGVDLLIIKDGIKTAVQIKRYKSKVNQSAVREVVAGMALKRYNAQRSMVVTNSFFTKSAHELADAHQCEMIDRDKLGVWILDLQAQTQTPTIGYSRDT